tara:strand:+ start:721 stop:2454 length:1734 start_codon:yes stop_codon:yes gene_type:complete
MAELDKLVVKIEADLKDLKNGLRQAQTTVSQSGGRMSNSLKNLGNTLANIGTRVTQFGGLFATAFAGYQVKAVIDVASSVESLGVRLEAIFGSVEDGNKALSTFVDFAGRVPFTLEEIQQGGTILATVSKDVNQLAKLLKITGNVASITGLDFRTTSEQIQRSFSGGIASADLFREKNIRAFLGFEQGAKVSISETVKAFEDVFGEGGRFGNATDKLANTFLGTISMLQDKLLQFRLAVAESFFEQLKDSLDRTNNELERTKRNIQNFGREIGESLANAVRFIEENIDRIGTSLSALSNFLLVTVLASFIRFVTTVRGLFITLATVVLTFADDIKKAFQSITGDIDNAIKPTEVFKERLKELERMSDINIEVKVDQQSSRNTEEVFRKLGEVIDDVGLKISDAFAQAIVSSENLGDALRNIFRNAITELISFITHLFVIKPLLDAIKTSLENIRKQQDDAIRKQLIMMALGMPSGGGGTGFGFRQAGGLVQAGRPTYVGESGRELIVPAVNSRVIPNSDLGGGITINQSLNFATGVVPTVRAEVMNMLPVIKQETMSAVADQRVRGGSFARTLVRGG